MWFERKESKHSRKEMMAPMSTTAKPPFPEATEQIGPLHLEMPTQYGRVASS